MENKKRNLKRGQKCENREITQRNICDHDPSNLAHTVCYVMNEWTVLFRCTGFHSVEHCFQTMYVELLG